MVRMGSLDWKQVMYLVVIVGRTRDRIGTDVVVLLRDRGH